MPAPTVALRLRKSFMPHTHARAHIMTTEVKIQRQASRTTSKTNCQCIQNTIMQKKKKKTEIKNHKNNSNTNHTNNTNNTAPQPRYNAKQYKLRCRH